MLGVSFIFFNPCILYTINNHYSHSSGDLYNLHCSMSKSKVKKWKEEYSQFGFRATRVDRVERPQCILCDVVFCNSNLKPSKLSEHFKNKHGGVEAGYNAETIKTKRACYDRSWMLSKMGFTSVEKRPRFVQSNLSHCKSNETSHACQRIYKTFCR